MRLVIDSNILLTTIGRKSKNRWLLDKFLNGDLTLIICNEILTEYLEIISEKTTLSIAENITNALLELPLTEIITIYYKWDLIKIDRDDNKFADCAFTGNADYLVTHDKHFDVLKTLEFPVINVLSIEELKNLIDKASGDDLPF
jgi:uncharacterized protein